METKNYRIAETSIPNNYSMMCQNEVKVTASDGTEVYATNDPEVNEHNFWTNPCITPFIALIATCADVIANKAFKPASGKAALLFSKKDDKEFENMELAVVSELIKEDEEEEGNWNFYFVFNPVEFRNLGIAKEDIHYAYNADDIFSQTENDVTFERSFIDRYAEALNVIGLFCIRDSKALTSIINVCIKCLKNWLDENAKEDEIVSVTLDAIPHPKMCNSLEEQNGEVIPFAIASVRVVKGVKEMSMTFSEELKLICKGNADSYIPFNLNKYLIKLRMNENI